MSRPGGLLRHTIRWWLALAGRRIDRRVCKWPQETHEGDDDQ